MSVQGRKRLEGEAGTRDWFNKWFPYHKQGVGASIMTMGGTQDIGDIAGVPFTMVEVKNHSNPVLGSLMNNAEWKANNAQRDFWILVIKRKGFGRPRAGQWYAVTSVSGLKNFGLIGKNGESLEELIDTPGRHIVSPKEHYKTNIWGNIADLRELVLQVNKCYNGVLEATHQFSDDDGIVLSVNPRRKHDKDDWIVTTTLDQFCQLLEMVGVLPEKDIS